MSATLPLSPAIEDESPSDLLGLQLLTDETAVDAAIATPSRAAAVLGSLAVLVVAGFAAHATALTLYLATTDPLGQAAQQGTAWFVAITAGYFVAAAVALPSYGLFGVVADVRAPLWRLAVEVVRVQAVGSVVLGAVLPFWLAGTMALSVLGMPTDPHGLGGALAHALPFLAATPGVFGLYRVFRRMTVANESPSRFRPLFLTGWWCAKFQYLAPLTIYALYDALI